jgi:hypothetical protein
MSARKFITSLIYCQAFYRGAWSHPQAAVGPGLLRRTLAFVFVKDGRKVKRTASIFCFVFSHKQTVSTLIGDPPWHVRHVHFFCWPLTETPQETFMDALQSHQASVWVSRYLDGVSPYYISLTIVSVAGSSWGHMYDAGLWQIFPNIFLEFSWAI